MLSDPSVRALFFSSLAGLSTVLGAVVIFCSKTENKRLLSVSLGFAAGIMLGVSFTDLLPNAEILFAAGVGAGKASVLSVVFLIVGLLTASGIDLLVPHDSFDSEHGEKPHRDLFRVGIVSTLAIALHNFPEGIATFMAGYKDATLGASIALAISLHNIPEGVAVAMPVYFATGSRKKALFYTLLSGIAEPVGALAAYCLLRPFIGDFLLGAVFSAVAGIMIYITMEELLPSSRQYGHDREALWASFAGICLMPLTHAL